MVAFAGVAVLGVLWGVGIAIALSLLNFIRRAWRPHDAVLGRVDNLKGYHDTERYPDARRIPGLVLYRFDAPLFFANADYFRERVRALARAGDVRWIVVAAEPITDIDATAGETLRALNDELEPTASSSRLRSSRTRCATGCAATASRPRSAVIGSSPPSAWPSPPTFTRPASTGSTGRIASLPMTPLPATDIRRRPSMSPARALGGKPGAHHGQLRMMRRRPDRIFALCAVHQRHAPATFRNSLSGELG